MGKNLYDIFLKIAELQPKFGNNRSSIFQEIRLQIQKKYKKPFKLGKNTVLKVDQSTVTSKRPI